MSRTVTALYDTREEAEAARQRLGSAVAIDRVNIIDNNEGGGGNSLGNLYLSNDDRQAYGEGVRRGGFLLCAEVHGHEDADRIVQLLEESPGVDLDERQNSWRSEGWSSGNTQSAGGFAGSASAGSIQSQTQSHAQTGNVVEEQHIPIVEEELRVGKREVERGGARVRSYVREVPVHEQVTLREEHVEVERRPVDAQSQQAVSGGLGANQDLLQGREIEMHATAEEAVVQKVANVTEEVVVRKTAEEHVEDISETVRHTEVDVQEGAADRSAFGGFDRGTAGSATQDGTSQASDFQRDTSR
jgi:uncharacterized protein (TIGR02271 family)